MRSPGVPSACCPSTTARRVDPPPLRMRDVPWIAHSSPTSSRPAGVVCQWPPANFADPGSAKHAADRLRRTETGGCPCDSDQTAPHCHAWGSAA
jgi:hypothetical protein